MYVHVSLGSFNSKGFDECISANQSESSCPDRLCSLAVSNFSFLSNSKAPETKHSNSNSNSIQTEYSNCMILYSIYS